MPDILINGKRYVASPNVTEVQQKVHGESFRTSGDVRREDNALIKRIIYSGWDEVGIGTARIRRDRVGEHGGPVTKTSAHIRDADADTRFPNGIVSAILEEAATNAAPFDHARAFTSFGGETIGLFEENYSGSAITMISTAPYEESSKIWGGSGTGTGLPTFVSMTANASTSASSRTFAHSTGSGANRALIVFVHNENSSAVGDAPSSVTYNSVSMTKRGEQAQAGGSGKYGKLTVWELANPTAGSNNVVVTWGSTQSQFEIQAMDFTGCSQSTPIRGSAIVGETGGASARTASALDVDGRTGDLALGCIVASDSTGNGGTVGTGATKIGEAESANTMTTSYERVGIGDASTTFDVSWSISSCLNYAVACVLAAPDGVVSFGNSNAIGVRAFDITSHKGKVYVLGSKGQGNEQRFALYRSSNGTTQYAEVGGTGWPTTDHLSTTITRRNNWDDRYGILLDTGQHLIVGMYDGSTLYVYHTADIGANWTATTTIGTSQPPRGAFLWHDPTTAGNPSAPIIVTKERVYVISISGTSATAIPISLENAEDDALGAAVGSDGLLYLSMGSGDHKRVQLKTGELPSENIGPATRAAGQPSDGLISTRQGHSNFLLATAQYLITCYGGHVSGQKASLFAYDYMNGSWHSLNAQGTANIDILRAFASADDDSVPKIHIVTDGTNKTDMSVLVNWLASPTSGATIKRASASYVEFAADDLGDPHTSSAIFKAFLDGEYPSTDETIVLKDGVNDEDWQETTRGTFNSSTDSIAYGTNGVGVSAKIYKPSVHLARGDTNTRTPILRDLEFQTRVKQAFLNGFIFEIDLHASRHSHSGSVEQVIADLETAISSVTLVAVKYGSTTYYMDVNRLASGTSDRPASMGAPRTDRQSGFYTIECKELI